MFVCVFVCVHVLFGGGGSLFLQVVIDSFLLLRMSEMALLCVQDVDRSAVRRVDFATR